MLESSPVMVTVSFITADGALGSTVSETTSLSVMVMSLMSPPEEIVALSASAAEMAMVTVKVSSDSTTSSSGMEKVMVPVAEFAAMAKVPPPAGMSSAAAVPVARV